jgi:hypothetical protein
LYWWSFADHVRVALDSDVIESTRDTELRSPYFAERQP